MCSCYESRKYCRLLMGRRKQEERDRKTGSCHPLRDWSIKFCLCIMIYKFHVTCLWRHRSILLYHAPPSFAARLRACSTTQHMPCDVRRILTGGTPARDRKVALIDYKSMSLSTGRYRFRICAGTPDKSCARMDDSLSGHLRIRISKERAEALFYCKYSESRPSSRSGCYPPQGENLRGQYAPIAPVLPSPMPSAHFSDDSLLPSITSVHNSKLALSTHRASQSNLSYLYR